MNDLSLLGVRIETLGCRLNQTESEGLAFLFAKMGFYVFSQETGNTKERNLNSIFLCIVNTCTVTSKAEQKARRLIRLLLKTHKSAIILVTGCYAELDSLKIENIDERIVTFSGKKKDVLAKLPLYLKEHLIKKKENAFFTYSFIKDVLIRFKNEVLENYLKLNSNTKFTPIFNLSSPTFMFHSRATLKVEDGCNNACTFCRIRLARGKAISLPLKEAVKRLKEIEDMGASEVVITGVNLSQYKSEGKTFPYLLESLLEETKNIKIRISSLYPEIITKEIISIIKHKRICPHFHLSIQSGSDEILKKMGRLYRKKNIYKAVERIREAKEKPFIGSDIITGFPSEDEECFLQTKTMCEELSFTGIHAFPFSPRPGTMAFSMKQKVSERTACERVEILNEIAKVNYVAYLKSCEGDKVFAVVEVSHDNKLFVTTENYLHLPFLSNKKHIGGDGVMVHILNGFAVETYDNEV